MIRRQRNNHISLMYVADHDTRRNRQIWNQVSQYIFAHIRMRDYLIFLSLPHTYIPIA